MSYKQFTGEHQSGLNRVIHMVTFFIATLVLMTWACGVWTIGVWLTILGVGGRLGHYCEGNRPAFFTRPLEIPLLIAYDGYMAVETFAMLMAGVLDVE